MPITARHRSHESLPVHSAWSHRRRVRWSMRFCRLVRWRRVMSVSRGLRCSQFEMLQDRARCRCRSLCYERSIGRPGQQVVVRLAYGWNQGGGLHRVNLGRKEFQKEISPRRRSSENVLRRVQRSARENARGFFAECQNVCRRRAGGLGERSSQITSSATECGALGVVEAGDALGVSADAPSRSARYPGARHDFGRPQLVPKHDRGLVDSVHSAHRAPVPGCRRISHVLSLFLVFHVRSVG